MVARNFELNTSSIIIFNFGAKFVAVFHTVYISMEYLETNSTVGNLIAPYQVLSSFIFRPSIKFLLIIE